MNMKLMIVDSSCSTQNSGKEQAAIMMKFQITPSAPPSYHRAPSRILPILMLFMSISMISGVTLHNKTMNEDIFKIHQP